MERKWIRVTNRLPESDVNVFVYNAGTDCYWEVFDVAWRCKNTARFDHDEGSYHHITHWMPLPEKPQGE